MKKLIIFDMDGVLVDSEPAITKAAISSLAEWGVNAEYGEFKQYTGMGDDIFVGRTAENHGVPYDTAMKMRAYEIYRENAKNDVLVYPWSKKIICELKEIGYSLAVASAADKFKVETNLECIGIGEAEFSAVVTAEHVIKKKPAPDIFLKAAELSEVSPDLSVVVEDALSGVRAAKAAGMTAVAVTTSFTKDELIEAGADIVTDSLFDLPKIIKNL